MVRFVAALSLIVASSAAAYAQAVPVPSHWKDGQGSEISLFTIDAKGNFTGKLTTRTPGFACANFPFDVSGLAHGHHLRFSVVWKSMAQDCKAHTSWTGIVSGKTMHTWWVMTSGEKRAAKKTHGADTFIEQ